MAVVEINAVNEIPFMVKNSQADIGERSLNFPTNYLFTKAQKNSMQLVAEPGTAK